MVDLYWVEVTGRDGTYELARGDAAPVIQAIAGWATETERAVTIYVGDDLSTARQVDQLMRAVDGTLRRTAWGWELLESESGGAAAWREAIEAAGVVA